MGQYSKFTKLQIEDLGTEGTGDRIALFDSDGKVVGYQNKQNNSYSTTEALTGETWIDGKPIYRKVITGDNSLTNDFLISSDLETICNSSGTYGTGIYIKPFPYFSIYEITGGTVTETEIYYEFSGTSKPTTLGVYSHSRATTGSGGTITPTTINFKIIIEYTKTTD